MVGHLQACLASALPTQTCTIPTKKFPTGNISARATYKRQVSASQKRPFRTSVYLHFYLFMFTQHILKIMKEYWITLYNINTTHTENALLDFNSIHSPTSFNICSDDVIREWKTRSNPGIWLKETAAKNTLLFADDQIIIQESEDELQRSIFYLNNICKCYNLKISINKTKTMAFKGKYPVRKKL
jgi:hypothetical protein